MAGRGKKENADKHPHEREKWLKSKRVNRPKQVWVRDNQESKVGYWEKINVK